MLDGIARSGFWRGKKVALTGATGFVGHHLALLLQQLGASVTALVRAGSLTSWLRAAGIDCQVAPLDEPDLLCRACQDCQVVFHLAGEVNFQNNWQLAAHTNVTGTRNVLAATRRAGVSRLVVTSSIVAVGAARHACVLDEMADWNLGNLRIAYVTTKRQAEQVALEASSTGPEVVVVNPSCVIGPDDFRGSEFGQLCQRFWRGRVPFYFGGGNNFVDVRDVVAGHLLAAQHGRTGQRYLLTGVNRTYGSFFSELARTAGRAPFRLRLPTLFACGVAALDESWQRRRVAQGRPAQPRLSRDQAALMGLYFFFSARKAEVELGFRARPFADTLCDTHTFWARRRSA